MRGVEATPVFTHSDVRFENLVLQDGEVFFIDYGHAFSFCAEFDLCRLLRDLRKTDRCILDRFAPLVAASYRWTECEARSRLASFYWFVSLRTMSKLAPLAEQKWFRHAFDDLCGYYSISNCQSDRRDADLAKNKITPSSQPARSCP